MQQRAVATAPVSADTETTKEQPPPQDHDKAAVVQVTAVANDIDED